MEIKLTLNGERIVQDIEPDLLLIDFVRKNGCYSVKRGCDTSNCGLCTVLLNDKPVLSCSVLAMRANGAKVVTLEGMQEEAKPLATFIASQKLASLLRLLQIKELNNVVFVILDL